MLDTRMSGMRAAITTTAITATAITATALLGSGIALADGPEHLDCQELPVVTDFTMVDQGILFPPWPPLPPCDLANCRPLMINALIKGMAHVTQTAQFEEGDDLEIHQFALSEPLDVLMLVLREGEAVDVLAEGTANLEVIDDEYTLYGRASQILGEGMASHITYLVAAPEGTMPDLSAYFAYPTHLAMVLESLQQSEQLGYLKVTLRMSD